MGHQKVPDLLHCNGFGTGRLPLVQTSNGEGVCRFHALMHLSEPTRTYFPKSPANTLLLTLLPFCGSPRTLADDPEQHISRRKSVWSISRRAQSERCRRAQKRQSTDQCPAYGELYWYLGASSRCYLVDHPLGDVGLQTEDRASTELDLLGEGPLSHPSVDGSGAASSASVLGTPLTAPS